MNIFCVISALANDYGAFDYETRLSQLNSSIDGIKEKLPEDQIWLYDASNYDIDESDLLALSSKVDRIKLLKTHPEILAQHRRQTSDPNFTGKKTVGELFTFLTFLHDLRDSKLVFDRVFKLAGRWQLTSDFDPSQHLLAKNHAVFRTREYWGHEPIYRIRLWSFDFNLLPLICDVFELIEKYTLDQIYVRNKIPILECTIHKYFTDYNVPVQQLEMLGVNGYFGQNASFFTE
jgi:hypothetical protein